MGECLDLYIEELKALEGFSGAPYVDVGGGASTIGWGHKIAEGEAFTGPITEAQAEELLKADVRHAEQKAAHEYGKHWNELLEAYRVLYVDLAYNVGSIKGYPKLRAALEAGALDVAEREYSERFYRDQDGQRRPLTARTAAVWAISEECATSF